MRYVAIMNIIRLTHDSYMWSNPEIQKQFQRLRVCKNARIRKLRQKRIIAILKATS